MGLTKVCKECGIRKNISEFGIRSSSKEGRANKCIACCNVAALKRYHERYDNDLEFKKHRLEWGRRYKSTKKYRDWENEYNKQPIRIAWIKQYKSTPKVKAADAIYRKTEARKKSICKYDSSSKGKTTRMNGYLRRSKNPEWLLARKLYKKEYYSSHPNIALKNKKRVDAWKKTERGKQHIREYRRENLWAKISGNLRGRLKSAIKNKLADKKVHTFEGLGMSVSELIKYLESKFQPGMTWANYGNKENRWSIDHIIPISKFDATDESCQLYCNHYTNLQPLWHLDNLKKGNKIIY